METQPPAVRLEWDFYDTDDFYPPKNFAKMLDNIPLNDFDRTPRLAALCDLIRSCLETGSPGVLACRAFPLHFLRYTIGSGFCLAMAWIYVYRRLRIATATYMTLMSMATMILVRIQALVFWKRPWSGSRSWGWG